MSLSPEQKDRERELTQTHADQGWLNTRESMELANLHSIETLPRHSCMEMWGMEPDTTGEWVPLGVAQALQQDIERLVQALIFARAWIEANVKPHNPPNEGSVEIASQEQVPA